MSGTQNGGDVSSAHGNGCESCYHRRHPDGGHCYMFKEEPEECYAHKYDREWVEQNSRTPGQKMNKHLESALAKLRECANSTMFVEVNYNEAAALLSTLEDALIATVENANMLDDAAAALKAMKAKIEAADRLAEAAYRALPLMPALYANGTPCTEFGKLGETLADYYNPQPAGGVE